MKLHPTPLAGLTVVETVPVADDRGRFVRIFCEAELGAISPGLNFPQVNLSVTRRRGSIRGMHFQAAPKGEAKLIRCLRGRVYDVAVDLRTGSDTFLRWHAIELTQDSERQVFIPEGFAHGFQALTDDVELLYFHTRSWSAAHERRFRYDDPRLAIDWPLPVTVVSEKDRTSPSIEPGYEGWTR